MTDRAGVVQGGPADYRFPDRFQVERVIGRGGSAVVFAARDLRLQRRVAIKVLDAEVAADDRELEQLEEAQVLAALSHPHLVTVYDTFPSPSTRQGENAFVVLEHVDGPDLAQYLRTTRLTVAQVLQVAIQLCSALAYVHDRGFLHRDLKPSNVLLTVDGDGELQVKLSDFGTAVLLRGPQEEGEFTVGTAAYLSPEQVEGTQLTAASDVYALGLVLLEAVTGQVAFPGSIIESAVARLDTDPVVPTWLPDALQAVLVGLTHRDATRRIDLRDARRTLQELQRTLDRPTSGGAPGDARPTRQDPSDAGAPRPLTPEPVGGTASSRATAPIFVPQEQELHRLLELACTVVPATGGAIVEIRGFRHRHRIDHRLPEVATVALRAALDDDPQVATGPTVHLSDDARFLLCPAGGGHDGGRFLVLQGDRVAADPEQEAKVLQGFADVVASALQLRDALRRALFAR